MELTRYLTPVMQPEIVVDGGKAVREKANIVRERANYSLHFVDIRKKCQYHLTLRFLMSLATVSLRNH